MGSPRRFVKKFMAINRTHRIIVILAAILVAILLYGLGNGAIGLLSSAIKPPPETNMSASVQPQSKVKHFDELRLGDSAIIGDLELTLNSISVNDEGVTLGFLGTLQEGSDGAEIALKDIVGDDIGYNAVEKTADTASEFEAVFKEVGRTEAFSVTFEGFELVQVSVLHQGSSAAWIVGDYKDIVAKRGV